MVASLLDGTVLEPVTHRGHVRAASVASRREKVTKEKAAVELMKVGAPKNLRILLSHGVKQGSINFHNPVEGADALFAA